MRTLFVVLSLSAALFSATPAPAAQQVEENGQSLSTNSVDVSQTLIGQTYQWVQTWNEKNVERMQQMHASDMLYGIGDSFITGEGLVRDIRQNNFWGVSWSIKMNNPHVRLLGQDAALVSFRLVGEQFQKGSSLPYSALFTVAFQRQRGEWKIVHVHDSDCAQ